MKTNWTLPTIDAAIAARDPRMIVQHDHAHDAQTCSVCRRTWGAGMSDYPVGMVADDDPGEACPDPECDGAMGVVARCHYAWRDPLPVQPVLRALVACVSALECEGYARDEEPLVLAYRVLEAAGVEAGEIPNP